MAPQLNRSIATMLSSGQVWTLRCDSARISTSVIAPLGKITCEASSTCPAPASTAATATAVSSARSCTGESGPQIPSTANRAFGDAASCRRSSVYLLAGSIPGMMWQDTAGPANLIGWTQPMDIDSITAEVAVAVGLAEGESGVRDVLVAVARHEPVPTTQIARLADLTVPIMAASTYYHRMPAVIDTTWPSRLL